jgi:hypothetical protein
LRGPGAVLALLLVIIASSVCAHHAPTEYDFDKTIEIAGTIVEVRWQNPHVTLKIRESERADGPIWEIEGSGVSMLRRTNAAAVRPQFREQVRLAGHPSRRNPQRLYGLNLLLASGQELVFDPDGSPRWKVAVAVGNGGVWFDGRAEASASGIFRVWSTKFDDPWLPGMPEDHLTEAAKEKISTWNPVTDSVTNGCEPVGVPMLMGQPYPIEFLQKHDRIVLRIELYDLERIIHTDPKIKRESLPKGLLGRSTGRWDGNSLLVRTDGITWPFLDYSGVPMSSQSSLLERFTPSSDGKRLSYSVIVTDPTYLTQPVKLERSWVARPNESVKPYNCVE